MNKYPTLVRVLDRLREEAPPEAKTYHPAEGDSDGQDKARSRAFIHLFLKVRFGLLSFREREGFITDGPYDGGVDAYYIDTNTKTISILQSKFRTTESNFEAKEISVKELLKMDADRMSKGETSDENGNAFNKKILTMLQKIKDLPDPARYKWQIVILANLKGVTRSDLVKVTGGFQAEVFDFDRTYEELVFPVVSGAFFNVSDLLISLNLTNKELSQSRINYPVVTEGAACDITIIFVPLVEIAMVLHKYKNSILRFNPRNYLDLLKNPVNREIASTVTGKSSNEFALFNNGITILSDETDISERIGKKNKGQLHIKNPQIINGGQTAFTLCRLYEDTIRSGEGMKMFDDKEVMLKIITFTPGQVDEDEKLKLIEAISKATNQQTSVSEADRRSNDKIQIELQKNLFSTFGYFYERKRGEFLDGLMQHYIDKDRLIDRETLLRICSALDGKASEARRTGGKTLFSKEKFDELLDEETDYREIFYGFLCFLHLVAVEKRFAPSQDNKYGVAEYGQGIRYGKYAIVSVVSRTHSTKLSPANYAKQATAETDKVLAKWQKFELYAMKKKSNSDYFVKKKDPATGEEFTEVNFDGYYKGKTVDDDLKSFKFY